MRAHALQVYDSLGGDVIVWGNGYTAAIAAYVANHRKVVGVVLQSPACSIIGRYLDTVFPFLCMYTMDTLTQVERGGDTWGNVLLVTGAQDYIIPSWHTETIYRSLNPLQSRRIHKYILPYNGHVDITSEDLMPLLNTTFFPQQAPQQ